MKKRSIILLLALALVLGISSAAMADTIANGTCGDNLTWTLDEDGVLNISGTGAMHSYYNSPEDAPWYDYSNSITSVIIEDGVTSIGGHAFFWYENITSVTIPDSVNSIECAFIGCRSLTSVTIPSGVTSIGDDTFYECTNLETVTISAGVTSIGDYAFEGCTSLKDVTIPESVTNIGECAFYRCNNLTSINVADNNSVYSSLAGVLFDKDKTTLIWFPGGKSGSYAIPDSVTSIGRSAFEGCHLNIITISDQVISIGDFAFSGSGLASITIPASVTSIGEEAFLWCRNLTEIIVEDDNEVYSSQDGLLLNKDGDELIFCAPGKSGMLIIPDVVKRIAEGAFHDCDYLTNVTIPYGVEYIDYAAFGGCDGLVSVSIPASVTSIEKYAFDCDNLTDVYFSGTQDDWDAIIIDPGYNEHLLNASIHYNYIENHLTARVDNTIGDWWDDELHVSYGGGAELKVIASAEEGNLTYRWVKMCEGGDIVNEPLESTGAAQTITNVTQDGLYVCYVTDKYGTVFRVPICVRVVFNAYAVGYNNYHVAPGGDVLLQVSIPSDNMNVVSFVWWQWTYNPAHGDYDWIELEDVNSNTLTVYNVDQNASYQCEVIKPHYCYDYIFSGGYIEEWIDGRTVHFEVIVDNNFSVEYVSDSWVTVQYGTAAKLQVKVTADTLDGVTYEWRQVFHDEEGHWLGETVLEETSDTLIIDSVTSRCEYCCYARDKYGSSCGLCFSVYVDNSLNAEPVGDSYLSVEYGSEATLQIDATASVMEGVTYLWKKYTYDLATHSRQTEDLGVTGPTLIIDAVVSSSEYYCLVRDKFGNEDRVWFTVDVENGFSAEALSDTSLVLDYGTTTTLQVIAEADDASDITYEWYRFDYINEDSWYTIHVNGKYYENNSAILTTDPVITHSVYYCNVRDRFGNTINLSFDVLVDNDFSATVFGAESDYIELKVPVGGSASLKVDANAVDKKDIKYMWGSLAQPSLDDEGNPLPVASGTDTVLIDGPGVNNNLEVNNVSKSKWYFSRVIDKFANIVDVFFHVKAIDNEAQAEPAPSAFDNEVEFVAELIEDANAPEGAVVYDLYFENSEGEHMQPNGEVTVSIPVPDDMDGSKCEVYYLDDEGGQIDMHAVYDDENGRLLFATTHFSHYAVVETEGASGTVIASGTCGAEGDGDNLTWTLYDDGVFVISGTGAMKDYRDGGSPWWGYGTQRKITSVVVDEGVTSIGSAAFYDCKGLASVTLPEGIISIGKNAFYQCTGLTEVNIPDSVTSIGAPAFSYCNSLTSISVGAGNTCYCSGEGVLFNKDKTTIICYPRGKGEESYVIPSTVTSIGDYAFASCYDLVEVTVPNGVTSIGKWTFSECIGIAEMTLPDGLASICDYAFSDCWELTSVNIPGSVTNIGESAFSDCDSLTEITIPGSVSIIGFESFANCDMLTNVIIQEGVTSIDMDAFSYSDSLASVTIPASVIEIGFEAFALCDKLTDVYYGGTEAQWNEIIIGTGNDCLTEAKIHFTEPAGYKVTLIDNTNKTNDVAVIEGIIDGEEYSGEVPFTVNCNRICVAVYTVGNEQIKLTPEIANGVYSFILPVEQDVTLTITYIGDVDVDRDVDNRDVLILARYLANWDGYDEMVYFPVADFNNDGGVDNIDGLILARYSSGWSTYRKYFINNP